MTIIWASKWNEFSSLQTSKHWASPSQSVIQRRNKLFAFHTWILLFRNQKQGLCFVLASTAWIFFCYGFNNDDDLLMKYSASTRPSLYTRDISVKSQKGWFLTRWGNDRTWVQEKSPWWPWTAILSLALSKTLKTVHENEPKWELYSNSQNCDGQRQWTEPRSKRGEECVNVSTHSALMFSLMILTISINIKKVKRWLASAWWQRQQELYGFCPLNRDALLHVTKRPHCQTRGPHCHHTGTARHNVPSPRASSAVQKKLSFVQKD